MKWALWALVMGCIVSVVQASDGMSDRGRTLRKRLSSVTPKQLADLLPGRFSKKDLENKIGALSNQLETLNGILKDFTFTTHALRLVEDTLADILRRRSELTGAEKCCAVQVDNIDSMIETSALRINTIMQLHRTKLFPSDEELPIITELATEIEFESQ